MEEKKEINDIIEWINVGKGGDDFCRIFNIPSPQSEEISSAISYLSQLLDNYSWYLHSIDLDKIKNKAEEHFKLLFADIFGELAISIKLAGEGYIKFSLRSIRAALDLFFAGLFSVSSWVPDSLLNETGINPFATAFFSGHWDKMKDVDSVDIDALIISELQIENEGKLIPVTSVLQNILSKTYAHIISEFGTGENGINKENEKWLKNSLKYFLNEFLIEYIRKTTKQNKVELSKTLKDAFSDTKNFYFMLFNDNKFAYKACEKHQNNLLSCLGNKLEIEKKYKDNLEEVLSDLTFRLPENDWVEASTCDYCGNNASIYGLYSKPNTRAMSKLIKFQLREQDLNEINKCIKNSFKEIGIKSKKQYFGDIIYSKIYSKLNNYVHSNVVDEPYIGEWLYSFFAPTCIVLQCILSSSLLNGNHTQ